MQNQMRKKKKKKTKKKQEKVDNLFDFGQFRLRPLAEVELAEVEHPRSGDPQQYRGNDTRHGQEVFISYYLALCGGARTRHVDAAAPAKL